MMILVSRTIAIAVLLMAIGCDSSSSDPARSQTNADLQLELGETGTSDGVTITFESVLGDSRCPEGVDCIWAGEAYVHLLVENKAEALLAADPDLEPNAVLRHGDVEIRAIELTPYPGSAGDSRGDTPVVSIATNVIAE